MGGSIFWTPGAGAKPWWVPDPIEVDGNKLNREIKLGENWDREAQLESSAKMDRVLTKEELAAIEHDEKLTGIEKALAMRDPEAVERAIQLDHKIRCWNADFIRDLSEEQQWAFVNTMDSMQDSALRLSNTPWQQNDNICGAVYGQCQAKIQMTSSLLDGKYADKMQEALDWFFGNTVVENRNNNSSVPLDMENPAFMEFKEEFKQLGSNADAIEFKKQLKSALRKLDYAVGNEFDNRPRPDGGTWGNFVGFLVADWDNYIWSLVSHGFKNLSVFMHEVDVTA